MTGEGNKDVDCGEEKNEYEGKTKRVERQFKVHRMRRKRRKAQCL